MTDKKILIFMGPPGVGKGTLASKFEDRMALTTVSTGQLFRENIEKKTELGLRVQNVINSGALVSDEIVNAVFETWFDENWGGCTSGILLDGYPRSLNQAVFLTNFLALKKVLKNTVVCLVEAQDQAILDRIMGRMVCSNSECGSIYSMADKLPEDLTCLKCGSHLSKRKDDDLSCAQVRLKGYRSYKNELTSHFLKQNIRILTVDTDGKNPESVFEEFKVLLSN